MSYQSRVARSTLECIEWTCGCWHERQLCTLHLEGQPCIRICVSKLPNERLHKHPAFERTACRTFVAAAATLYSMLLTRPRRQELVVAIVQLDIDALWQLLEQHFRIKMGISTACEALPVLSRKVDFDDSAD